MGKAEATANASTSISYILEVIYAVIKRLLIEGQEVLKEADALSSRALEHPPSPALFTEAAECLASVSVGLKEVAQLALLGTLIDRSYRNHCHGEACYFRGEYELASEHFRTAAGDIDACLVDYASLINQRLCPNTAVVIKGYQYFYEIESIEALAFQAMKSKDWDYALSLHEKDIALTEIALTLVQNMQVPLKGRLEGHLWFAKRGFFECLAHISMAQGDLEAQKEYMRLSREANEQSLQVNPAYQSQADARQRIIEKVEYMASTDSHLLGVLDTTWIDEQDLASLTDGSEQPE